MCFSIEAQSNLKKLSKDLGIGLNKTAYESFKMMQELESSIEQDQIKKILGLKRKPQSDIFRTPENDGRVFPNYFTNVVSLHNGVKEFGPMRYRVRPAHSSEEIPTKFNVFNARLDSLEKRQTWAPLFMRKHGVIPFNAFYEWVIKDGKKSLIKFAPTSSDTMWAPCLWDEWKSNDGLISFKSFAIITTDPPKEIEVMGHDRCPIFIQDQFIDSWLNPKDLNPEDAYEILTHPKNEKYRYEWA